MAHFAGGRRRRRPGPDRAASGATCSTRPTAPRARSGRATGPTAAPTTAGPTSSIVARLGRRPDRGADLLRARRPPRPRRAAPALRPDPAPGDLHPSRAADDDPRADHASWTRPSTGTFVSATAPRPARLRTVAVPPSGARARARSTGSSSRRRCHYASLNVAGGRAHRRDASGQPCATATVGGTVPATLALTLGAPASFGAFTPGVAKDYTASTTANVDLHRRRRGADGERSRPPDQRRVLAPGAAAGRVLASRSVDRPGVQRPR